MKREPFIIAAMFILVSACAGWFHKVREIVDIADDLCQNAYSKPEAAPELAGLSVAEFCAKPAVRKMFEDKARGAQSAAKASLSRPAQ